VRGYSQKLFANAEDYQALVEVIMGRKEERSGALPGVNERGESGSGL